jgi:hypothetical protein
MKIAANKLMRLARYRNIIVALLMVAFVGQAVASSAMSCLSEISEIPRQEQVIETSAVDHSHHMNINADNDLETAESCSDGGCCLGGCSAAMLPVAQPTFIYNDVLLTGHYLSPPKNQLTVSLYRPPISR